MTGGMESMSNAPYLLPGARFGFRMGDKPTVDAMTHDGLTNPFTHKQMINEASEVLERARDHAAGHGPVGRPLSHQLAAQATDEGRLAEEIVSVTVKTRKAENVAEADEAIRPDSTVETLAKLPAVGGDDATHTAGNSPGVNDGAAAVVVAFDEWAEANGRASPGHGARLRHRRRRFPYLARTPRQQQALDKLGRSADEIDLWEINEAFASVALNSLRMLGAPGGRRQRQRRGDRAGASDRRLRRLASSGRSFTSSAVEAAASHAARPSAGRRPRRRDRPRGEWRLAALRQTSGSGREPEHAEGG